MDRQNQGKARVATVLVVGIGILALLFLSLRAEGQINFGFGHAKSVKKDIDEGQRLYGNGDYEGAKAIFDKIKECKMSESDRKRFEYFSTRCVYALKMRHEGHVLLLHAEDLLRQKKEQEALPLVKELIINSYLIDLEKKRVGELYRELTNPPTNYKELMNKAHKAFQSKDYATSIGLAREAQKHQPFFPGWNPLDTPARLIRQCEEAMERDRLNPPALPLPLPAPQPQPPIPAGPPPMVQDKKSEPSSIWPFKMPWTKDAPKESVKDGPDIKDVPKKLDQGPPLTPPPNTDGPPLPPLPQPPPADPTSRPVKTSDAGSSPVQVTARMSAQELPPPAPTQGPDIVTGAPTGADGIVPVAGFTIGGFQDKNAAEDMARKRALAKRLIEDGYKALFDLNDLDQARKFAEQAQQLKLTYGRNDPSPEKLLDEIIRRERAQRKTATPDMLPDPAKKLGDPAAATSSKPGTQPKMDAKAMVRQAREFLSKEMFDDAEKLINLAADARPKGWGLFEDSPDKLRSDLTKLRSRREREQAAKCMIEGRKLLKEGNLEEAKKQAFLAQKLHGPYSIMELGDKPQRLLEDIHKLEAKSGVQALPPPNPFAEENHDDKTAKKKVEAQLVSRTNENEKKARAYNLMAQARELQSRGLLAEARGRVVAASKIQAAFTAEEESPESLLIMLAAQCGNTLNQMLQQSVEQCNNPSDPARFDRALFTLNQARQLCAAFELDPVPIDQRIVQVQQIKGVNPGQKVVSEAQVRGLDLLKNSRLELEHGNNAQARRLAEQAFNGAFDVKDEALLVLRSIDAADFDRTVRTANKDAQTALGRFYAKDYRGAAALLTAMDIRNDKVMKLLTVDNQRKLRTILTTAEMQKELQARGDGKDGGPADPKNPAAKLTISDQPEPPNGFEPVEAMMAIQAQKLRADANRVQLAALETFKSEPQQAIDMLKEFLDKLDQVDLDPTQKVTLRRPIESRINQYRTIQAKMILDEERRNAAKPGHDEDKRNLDIRKTQDDVAKLINVEFRQQYKEGKYLEAEATCRKALELDPDNTAAALGLEMCRTKFQVDRWKTNRAINEKAQTDLLENSMFPKRLPSPDNPVTYSTDEKTNNRRIDRIGSDKALATTLRSPREKEIEFKLSQPISVSFRDTKLEEVITTLKALGNLDIVPDLRALREVGIGLDSPLSLSVNNLQLKSVLNILLKQVGLTYVIRDGVLQITTEQQSIGNRVVKVYPIADLVMPIGNSPTSSTDDIHKALMRQIQGTSGYSASVATPIVPMNALPPGQVVGMGMGGGLGQAMSGSPGEYDPASSATLFGQLASTIKGMVAQNTWSDVGGKATMSYFSPGMAMIVDQTEEVHDQIAGLLSQLRRTQEVQVAIEMRIIQVSEQFYQYVNMNFDVNFNSTSGAISSAAAGNNATGIGGVTFSQTAAGAVPSVATALQSAAAAFAVPAFATLPGALGVGVGMHFLNDIQVYMFMEAARGDKRSNVMQAPRLTVVNGTTANISMLDQMFFATGANLVQAGAQVFFLPTNNPFPVGINLQVTPVVSADRRFVRMHLVPTMTNLVSKTDIPVIPVQIPVPQVGPGGVQSATIATMYFQQPSFSIIKLETTVNVPDGGTVLLGGMKTLADTRSETGPPVLADLPLVSRLFRSQTTTRDSKNLMIMVTPRIIINEEEEMYNMGQMAPVSARR